MPMEGAHLHLCHSGIPQGHHARLPRSLEPWTSCLEKWGKNTREFLFQVLLTSWRLDAWFPESLSAGRAAEPGQDGPWRALGCRPVRLTERHSLFWIQQKKQQVLEMGSRKQESRGVRLHPAVKGALLSLAWTCQLFLL